MRGPQHERSFKSMCTKPNNTPLNPKPYVLTLVCFASETGNRVAVERSERAVDAGEMQAGQKHIADRSELSTFQDAQNRQAAWRRCRRHWCCRGEGRLRPCISHLVPIREYCKVRAIAKEVGVS